MGEAHEQAERLSDQALIEVYQSAREDTADRLAAGQAIMGRLLEKVDLGDHTETLLMRRDGSALANPQGKALRARDYLEVAGAHPGATETIFNFVAMPESDPQFPVTKGAMAAFMKMYLFPDSPDGS